MRTPNNLLKDPTVLFGLAELLQTIDEVLEASAKLPQDYQPITKPFSQEEKREEVGIGMTE